MNVRFNPRIVVAVFLGAVLIGGAWWWTVVQKNNQPGEVTALGEPLLNDELPADLSQYINPNWQDALGVRATSTYTPPTTLTGKYAVNLLESIMSKNLEENNDTSVEEIVDKTFSEIEAEAADDVFTVEDINTNPDTSTESLRRYGNQVMQITLNYPSPYEQVGDELTILDTAWNEDDEEKIKELDVHIQYMESVIRDTKNLSAPAVYEWAHVRLLNAYLAHLNDLKAMRAAFDDPLFTMLRLREYNANQENIYNAYNTIYTLLYNSGVRWTEDDVVNQFVVIGNN